MSRDTISESEDMSWIETKQKREERGQIVADMKGLLKKAEDEKRDLTPEEDKRFDFLLMRPAPPLGTERATFAVATKGAFDAADATDSDAATRR